MDLKTFLFLFPGRKQKFISYTGMEKNLRKKGELELRTYCFFLVELQETLAVHSVGVYWHYSVGMTGSSENHLTFSRHSDPSCFLLIRILTVVNTNDILNYKMGVCMYTCVCVCI